MRLLIVDDEPPARARLRHLLAQVGGIEVEEAADGIEALERIAACRPDALLLDIEMPELSGIELAASLPDPAPLVVFVTAYERYALDAFDADAIDYLLKPCDPARLARALERLEKRLERVRQAAPAPAAPAATASVAAAPALPPAPLQRLLVSERGVTRVVHVADIQWIETADNYVVLHTATGSPLLRQTLAGLLARLGPAFERCHRRAAVQLAWIEGVASLDGGDRRGDYQVQLRGGARVPCSRQFRAGLMARL
jgi:two-component system LytT family response regulator